MSFHYNLPPTNESKSLYEGLSEGARRALTGTALRQNPADMLMKTRSLEKLQLSAEAKEWAEYLLFVAADKWQRYGGLLSDIPHDTDSMLEAIPDLENTLTQLHKIAMRHENPDSISVLLVPYAGIREQMETGDPEDWQNWLTQMRQKQAMAPDCIPNSIRRRLDRTSSENVHYIKASDGWDISYYLDYMVEHGDWDIFIVGQAEATAKSPKKLRRHSDLILRYTDFGVIEWLAHTLQDSPNHEARVLLPGSSFPHPGGTEFVAVGGYDDTIHAYTLNLLPADSSYENTKVLTSFGVH